MNDNGNTLLAIIAGSAIGAAIGVLYAPDKGLNTRRRIAEEANRKKNEISESAIDWKDRVANTIASEKHTLEEKVGSIVTDASYKTEDVITTLESKLAELKARNKKLQKTV